MSPSRSATTVTSQAPAQTLAASSVPCSQRKLSFSSIGRDRRLPRWPDVRSRNCPPTRPSNAPSSASTATTACRKLPPPPSERTDVVSWIARACRPMLRVAVRRAASASISSTVTASLRKNRVSRISPARFPPSRRTTTERPPVSTSRDSRKTPVLSRRLSSNTPNPAIIAHAPTQTRAPNQPSTPGATTTCECGSPEGEGAGRRLRRIAVSLGREAVRPDRGGPSAARPRPSRLGCTPARPAWTARRC